MAQGLERGLDKGLALRRMGMDSRGDILEPSAHLKRQAERGRQFRDAGAHGVKAEEEMIIGPRHNADKATLVFKRHGTAIGPEWKESRFDLDA